jgi:hypothetical protein
MRRRNQLGLAMLVTVGTTLAYADSITQTISANMASGVDIGFTAIGTNTTTSSMLTMSATAPNTDVKTLRVSSTDVYHIGVSCDTSTKASGSENKLYEYSTSGTVGYVATSPKIINAVPTVTAVTGGAGGTGATVNISTSQQDIWTSGVPELGADITATFSVSPPYGSPVLSVSGREYRMVLTYTATVGT